MATQKQLLTAVYDRLVDATSDDVTVRPAYVDTDEDFPEVTYEFVGTGSYFVGGVGQSDNVVIDNIDADQNEQTATRSPVYDIQIDVVADDMDRVLEERQNVREKLTAIATLDTELLFDTQDLEDDILTYELRDASVNPRRLGPDRAYGKRMRLEVGVRESYTQTTT